MGRPRKRSLFPIALSIDATAEALSIPRRIVVDAIAAGELVAYGPGPGRRIRILVADCTDWIARTWPRAMKRSKS